MRMKVFVLAIIALVGFANALEREQEFGAADSELSPVEETTVQDPVTRVKPNVRDDDDSDTSGDSDENADSDGEDSRPTECSSTLCSGMCRRSGCQEAICLPNRRCGCLCARQISSRDFLRRIFGSGYTPRFGHHVPSFPRIFDFPTIPRFEDRFRDISKLFDTLGNDDGLDSKVYYTMQRTCEQAEDCSHVCSNCTTTNCADGLCQCARCSNSDAVESRAAGRPEKTCSGARECETTCKGCAKIGCRYGTCECGKCNANNNSNSNSNSNTNTNTDTNTNTRTNINTGDNDSETSTAESSSEESNSTPPSARVEASTVSVVDILSLRPSNQTRDDVTVNGKCVPKRCNHACWERQCSKWNCVDDRCDCDGCPDDMAVMVRNANGRSGKPEDTNKYEIIF